METITASGHTLHVGHAQIHEPIEPGQVLLSGAPFCDNLNTGCIIAGRFMTHDGVYSQIHQYRDGRYFAYGPLTTQEVHPSRRERYATPEGAVKAALTARAKTEGQ